MRVIGIYPGRFHPFHKGHASSFKQLAQQFGLDNTYLAISSKQEQPKSPFSAQDRAKMAMALGIPSKNIIGVRNPYAAQEYIDQLDLDPEKTALVFGVSKKDMEGEPALGIPPDPRFSFKPKRDGSPAYLQPYSKNVKPMDQHGYVMSTDVAEFPIAGKTMRDASAIRKAYAGADEKTKMRILKDLYGDAAEKMKQVFDNNLQITETIRRLISAIKPMLSEASTAQKAKFVELLSEAKKTLNESQVLDEAPMKSIVQPLITAFNLEHGAEERWANMIPLHSKSSMKRWRRGDGSYYTDPNRIVAFSEQDREYEPKFFGWLQQQPGVQPAGQIRGEFRSSDYSPAVKYKGLIFIDRGSSTEYTTTSRLRNSNVWHQKVDEYNIRKTKKFIQRAHDKEQGQMYGNMPYSSHPKQVANLGKKFFGSKFNDEAVKVALLHDVLEDTPYTPEQLAKKGFSKEVIEAVQLLTKNKALSYADNIRNIINSGNPLAMMVKYCDNYMNYSGDKSHWDADRAAHSQKKYLASLNMLGDVLGIKKHVGDEEMINEKAGDIYSARQCELINDLGDGYFLGDDSYDDDDGFVKEGYSVYHLEGPDQYRLVGHVNMSPYRNPPGHVKAEIKKLIASDQNNVAENTDYLEEK